MRHGLRLRRFGALGAIAALAACGGHASVPAAGGPSGATAATLRIQISPPQTAKATAHSRHALFVAATTNGIDVKVYAQGDTSFAHPLGEAIVDVSSGSAACGGTSGTRTCSVPIPAPAGADAFVVRTYDAVPSGGALGNAKQLAAAIVNQTIVAGTSNTVSIALGGVPASVKTYLGASQIVGRLAFRDWIAVTAFDADGNAILSDGYVDANGDPVTIALTQNPSPADLYGGSIALGSTSLSAPSATGISIAYDGLAKLPCTSHPCQGTFTDTFTATASNGIAPAASTLTVTLGPIFEYPTPGFGQLAGIVSGSDGALWFTDSGAVVELDSGNKIGRISTGGSVSTFTVPAGVGSGIAAGPDGALWFVAGTLIAGGAQIDRLTTGGSITEFPIFSTIGTANLGPIAAGSDGNLWFTVGSYFLSTPGIARMTTAGAITLYTVPTANSNFTSIISGPDGALWFTEYTGQPGQSSFDAKIGRITTAGTITEYTVPSAGSDGGAYCVFARPAGIAAGPDGALWFTIPYGNKIGRITTAGAVTEYSLPTNQSGPAGITAGPNGALWFTESCGNKIGTITTGGAITEYSAGLSGGGPSSITLGPDGNLWFTEVPAQNANTKIGVLTW
jgi:streptogramin lyase